MKHDPKDSAKAINAFASRVMRRLQAAGDHSYSFEDVKQELWIAWCLACDAYKPESGVPFLAYLRNGMRQHMNRHIEKNVDRRIAEVHALTIDGGLGFGEDRESGGGLVLAEVIPAAGPSALDLIEESDATAHAMTFLSPRAQAFVQILREQPEDLLEQVQHYGARSNVAREAGFILAHQNRLTASMVFDLMDASRPERIAILKEIRTVGERAREGSLL